MYTASRTILITAVALLVVLGITMLYSTTYYIYGESLLLRQLIWIILGCAAALLLNITDYRWLDVWAGPMLICLALALAYLAAANIMHQDFMPEYLNNLAEKMPFVRGLHVGSARWLKAGNLRFQPSEFATLAVILFLSRYFTNRQRHFHTFYRGFFIPMVTGGGIAGLILLGGNLSSAVIAGAMVFWLFFIAGIRLRFLALTLILGITASATTLYLSPTRMQRLQYYRHPEEYQNDQTYQLWASQLAIGSGGWHGRGFTESRIKRSFLPEAHTDFIVAIIGEEIGFFGIVFLLSLYAVTVSTILWIGAMAVDQKGLLLCSGIALAIGLRALVNIGVVGGFLPTTGVTAPLVSYGGSSIFATLTGIGLVLNISRVAGKSAAENKDKKSEIIPPRGRHLSHRNVPPEN